MNPRKEKQLKEMLQAIENGTIVKDGKLLSERELEATLHMSRLHIRECLNILEAYGVIDIRERQGIFVARHDVDNAFRSLDAFQSAWPVGLYDEISEVRRLIEVPAARLAAERRNEKDLEHLNYALDMLHKILKLAPPERGIQGAKWNAIFHNLIASAAHNSVLLRMYECVITLSQNTLNTLVLGNISRLPQDEWPDQIGEEHDQLADAISKQDGAAAAKVMDLHLVRTYYRYKLTYTTSLEENSPAVK
jgi:GntR family transcriptional repressor for pyruvate dehydrogenase complex